MNGSSAFAVNDDYESTQVPRATHTNKHHKEIFKAIDKIQKLRRIQTKKKSEQKISRENRE